MVVVLRTAEQVYLPSDMYARILYNDCTLVDGRRTICVSILAIHEIAAQAMYPRLQCSATVARLHDPAAYRNRLISHLECNVRRGQ